MDQNIARYRISIQLKRWWRYLFTMMLNATIHDTGYNSNRARPNSMQQT